MPVDTTVPSEPGWRVLFGYRFLRLRTPVVRRLVQLIPGLILFGLAIALMVASDLGTNPWTVFAQGVAERTGTSVGTIVALTGLTLLIAFGPLGEPVGLGTLLNVAIIGPIIDVALAIIGEDHNLITRVLFLGLAPPVLGLASGLYLGAGLGPGPRDGLMTAWARRGVPIARARTMIELTALAVGWLLGGVVGIGTIYFGLTVGFWVRTFLARLQIDRPVSGI
ncbi:MAG: YczE/YyaS/YitT family protein [Acidimicrobiales bacterium]